MRSFVMAVLVLSVWLVVPLLLWGSETMNLAIPGHPLPNMFWDVIVFLTMWTVTLPMMVLGVPKHGSLS